MMWRLLLLWWWSLTAVVVVVVVVGSTAAVAAAAGAGAADDHVNESLLEWAVRHGTIIHPSLVWLEDDEESSTNKYWAVSSPVHVNTVLLTIPLHLIVQPLPIGVGSRVEVLFHNGESYWGTVLQSIIQQPDDDDDSEDNNDEYYEVEFDDGDVETVNAVAILQWVGLCALTRRVLTLEDYEMDFYKPYLTYIDQLPLHMPHVWKGRDLAASMESSLIRHDHDWLTCKGHLSELNDYLKIVQLSYHHHHPYGPQQQQLIPLLDRVERVGEGHGGNVDVVWNDHSVEVKVVHPLSTGDRLQWEWDEDNTGVLQVLSDTGVFRDDLHTWAWDDDISFTILHDDDDDDNNQDDHTTVEWNIPPTTDVITKLKQKWHQLQYLMETDLSETIRLNDVVPEKEMAVMKQFVPAFRKAIERALESQSTTPQQCDEESCRETYDSLTPVTEIWGDERPETCEWDDIWNPNNWDEVEHIRSFYQRMTYSVSALDDTCLDLDNIIQICDSYRPHYHEMAVHHTARFLPTLQRVLFVGGGDSMLLHEVLKYDSVQLVVGLELDQQVTRSAFKYFGTQPHWDDDRVEWWFGDATKSLLMLPQEYFGSFDLVLVDLSETVMALTVTDGLNVMQALSLLVKDTGIVVKNEYMYFLSQSAIFEHTVHIHWYGVPFVCSQSMILSSNSVDFLRDDIHPHDVEHLYFLLDTPDTHQYRIVRDYQRNETSSLLGLTGESKPVVSETNPGILFIVEVENVSTDLSSVTFVKDSISQVARQHGLTIISSIDKPFHSNGGFVTVLLEEGYVVARTWPEHAYCALDVHFWASFDKQKAFRDALITSFGSKVSGPSSSSYRIVAGGMSGLESSETDLAGMGPPAMTTSRTRRADSSAQQSTLVELVEAVAVQEALTVIRTTNSSGTVAVLCDEQKPCPTVDWARDLHRPILKLSCAEREQDSLLSCQQKLHRALLDYPGTIDSIVLDARAPVFLAQVVVKLLQSSWHVRTWLSQSFSVVAVTLDSAEEWRRVFVGKFPSEIAPKEPVFSSLVKSASVELGIASSGDTFFAEHLVQLSERLESRSSLDWQIYNIRGGKFDFFSAADFHIDKVFTVDDFDMTEATAQWRSQRPLAFQVVMQFEGTATASTVASAFESARGVVTAGEGTSTVTERRVGDGTVHVAVSSQTSMVMVWDGRKHVDVNVFTLAENFALTDTLHAQLTKMGFEHRLMDEQPRGFGRVVNFRKDVEASPNWIKEKLSKKENTQAREL